MSTSKVYLKVRRVAAEVAAQAAELTVADVHESMDTRGRDKLANFDRRQQACE